MMKKKLKALRARKAQLETDARAKLALVTAEMPEADARKIEAEHAELLKQVAAVDGEIRAAMENPDDVQDDRAAKSDDGDDKDDDEDDDEDDDSDDDSDGKKRRVPRQLTREAMAEMAQVDTFARGIGVELDLADCIVKGVSANEMRKRAFAELAKKSRTKGPRGSATGLEVLHDEGDGKRGAMEIALIRRVLDSAGSGTRLEYKPKHREHAAFYERHRAQSDAYMGMNLVEIAASCINYRGGGLITAARAVDIFERAFNTTSDFPSIFQNVLNKSLLARYELAAPTYRELAVERPFNDFRPHPQIRAGDFPQLQAVSESGELIYGKSADSGENVSVAPYGVIFTISRTMLVNDDLGAIDQILGSAGDTVLVFENTTFFTMFNSNPTLSTDSLAVFHATHGNLAGSGAAPSIATIGAARQALRGMKSLNNLYLNVPPRIILTGPVQETAADQMVTSITPTLVGSVNPFSGRLRSVSDANITDNSWYVLTEPGRVPSFIYGFLNGSGGPRVRTFEPFGVQGIKVSLEHDFGVGAIDYRGAYRNPGS